MYNDQQSDDAESRGRRIPKSRLQAPRATRTTKQKRKTPAAGVGGVHRRRNKHWSW